MSESDNTRAAVAAGMAAGYLLGRTKKAKLAIALASFALGRRAQMNPRTMVTEGLRKLGSSPQFGQVKDRVRGELAANGRSAVNATVKCGCDAIADTLAGFTRSLAGGGKPGRDEGEGAGGDEGEAEAEGQREQKQEQKQEPAEAEGEEQGEGEEQAGEGEEAKGQGEGEGEEQEQEQGGDEQRGEAKEQEQGGEEQQGEAKEQGEPSGTGRGTQQRRRPSKAEPKGRGETPPTKPAGGRKPGEPLPSRRPRPLRPVRSSTPQVSARRGGDR
ncbi:hypothetical protein AQ490_24245 [Wenjunlia vitaminophila]|uniref:Uncharacterized protein n=1 Tax=Wenjunlia vitaminophila TaxID=76728 RepID=A0A0T6LRL8_WENVI|nr:hypothetical protein [Wenjunlia vitaminophila]KRV48648.1 hypothetical protein AQ490_24245 [Wenjunlia vitaminophila]